MPAGTRTSLAQRLRQHWPQLSDLHIRYHGQFAYIEGELATGDQLPLIRLRYGGSASTWGFGLYLACSGKLENQILPAGMTARSPRLRLRPLRRPLTRPPREGGNPDQLSILLIRIGWPWVWG